MSVAIIMLQYGKAHYTVAAVRSILEKGLPAAVTEFHVIDNASPNEGDRNALLPLSSLDNRVRLHFFRENYGFAGAHNRVRKDVDADFFLLINNDTLTIDDSVSRFIDRCHSRQDKLATGSLINKDGSAQISTKGYYGFPSPIRRAAHSLRLRHDEGDYKNVFYCNGAFLWIDSKLFDDLNGFDDSLFMYGEDLDLMIRASKRGFSVRQYVDAKIIHYGGGSSDMLWQSDQKLQLQLRQGNAIIRRHYGALALHFGNAVFTPLMLLKVLRWISVGKLSAARTAAKIWYWKLTL